MRFIARSGDLYVLIKMVCLIVFQVEKRQQIRQAGQRWTAFFGGESGFRGQQHHSLGITTGLVRRNNLLLMATLPYSVYDQPGRSLRVLSICQN